MHSQKVGCRQRSSIFQTVIKYDQFGGISDYDSYLTYCIFQSGRSHEAAGVVESVGAGVTHLQPGAYNGSVVEGEGAGGI